MCRLAYVPKNSINESFLRLLFSFLEKANGGDGNGIGGFVNGQPFIWKSSDTKQMNALLEVAMSTNWDNGFIFHTRSASIGGISDTNCHPYVYDNTITAHNGHVLSIPAIKIMMLENNIWDKTRLLTATDSEIIAYYINKYGFEMVNMFDSGVIMTSYPTHTLVRVMSNSFEFINHNGVYIYASEFPKDIALKSEKCSSIFGGTTLKITSEGVQLLEGGFADAKPEYRKAKNNKGIIYIGD